MGLANRHKSGFMSSFSQAGHWFLPASLVTICSLLGALGEAGRDWLRYDRLAISDGELWRLMSGHLVHLGWSHLILNMAGLLLVWLLVGRYFRLAEWLLVLLLAAAVASAGFWFVDRNMLWYVGLSGVLHGLVVAGALRGLRELPWESAIILLGVIAKLAWEQVSGPLPGSESASGGSVVVSAHLYGALGGATGAGILWRRDRDRSSI